MNSYMHVLEKTFLSSETIVYYLTSTQRDWTVQDVGKSRFYFSL